MKKISTRMKVILFLLVVFSVTLISLNPQIKAADERGKITVTKSATKSMTASDLEKYPYLTEENLQKGRYAKVNLNVSAKGYTVETEVMSKLDIVIIFDSSNSMEGSRMSDAKAAARDFANTLLDDSGSVQIAIVEFGTQVLDVQDLTSDSTTITNFIDSKLRLPSYNDGGTNLQSAISKANSILDSGREDSKKIVIILTDGTPTFFNYDNQRYGSGSSSGSYTESCVERDYRNRCTKYLSPVTAAKEELDSLKSEHSTTDVYTIAFADSNATTALSTINPANANNASPSYKNYEALTGDTLKDKFGEIAENAKNTVGTNSKLTDVIPVEFQLPKKEVERLENLGIEVTINDDGTTTLVYDIGAIEADKNYQLEFIVEAKPAYYGTVYTNESAKLETTIDATNPYYCTSSKPCDTNLEITVSNPKVEIPTIASNDSYGNIGYAEDNILITTSILNNDSMNDNFDEIYNVIEHKIIIVEDDNVTRNGTTNQYTIKDKGIITINEDGTFEFTSFEGVKGNVEFNYYVATFTKEYDSKETTVTYSNSAKVTFSIQERELIKIEGQKTWDDNNNQDGVRSESITIHLYKNGEYVTSKVVTSKNDWKYSFDSLYKYAIGEEGKVENKYSIKEDIVEGYTTKIDGYNVTNKHEVEKVSVSGTKTWEDNNNQDGIRPTSITINLLADGEVIETKEVTEKENWSYEFKDLDKYKSGKEIVYTIEEEKVEGYTTEIDGYNVTNKHVVEKVSISGTKTWDDNNNQDGIRPTSITINLLADGKVIETKEVTEKEKWSYEFKDLDKYKSGNEIVYTIEEEKVEGYTTTITGYNVTNKHEVEKVSVSGTKTWEDNNNQDGIRPESITINLLADGKVIETKEVTEKENWSYSFKDLDKYESGNEIVYTIEEEKVEGYTTKIDGYNVTNKHEVEKVSVSGTKTWVDNDNQDGKRPSSIMINLLADGEVIASLPVTSLTNWKYSFKDLDKYKSGREIVYTIEEEKVEGYTTEIDGYNVTNKHEVEKVSVSGTKTWDDNNNQDGIRPTSITINLLADGKVIETKEVTEKENWSYEFKDLDKYESGNEIVYTIEEEKVEGYTTEIDGYNVTNKHEAEKVSVSGTKTWDDNNNQDGKRPNEITVILLADGNEIDTKIVTSETEWKYTFENLPKYRDGGIEVKYTVEEEMVDGYTSSVNGYNITNTYTPETITVKGKKTWNDKNNQDGKRPLNISINLYANGEYTGKVVTIDASDNWKYEFTNLPKYADGKEIVYTIEEDKVAGYTTVINGFDITNSYTTETTKVTVTKTWNDNNDQDGKRPESITINLLANNKIVKSAKVTEKDNWSYTFENLDKYANGELVTYTVEEEAVEGYKAVVDGYNITNTHTPITLSINGEKVWVDNNDEAGFRPESITVNLLANGEVIDTKLVTSEAEWKYTFENLPMYKDGQKIKYEVEELTVDNYETSYDNENPFIIVNTHNPSKITVSGIKTWVDNNDQDGIRPDSITINLTGKIGDEIVYEDSKVVSADDNWKYEFTNLPEYKYGKLISYTIDEEDVEGYSKEINGYDVINTHTPETIIINGSKVWDDNNNQDGIRPDKITVNLLADDKVIDTKDVSINEEGNWIFEFKNLPKYRDGGIEVNYSITEESVDGYESEITDFEITNIHTPETVSYNVSKVWSDYENNDGIRPNSITVRLIADGKEILSQVINEENNWSYSFENLPKYRDEGTLIVYEIVEDEVLGYTTTIESSVDVNNPNNTIVIVTNSHEKEQNSITISKIWEDYNNKYGKRPESITIHLYADGELVETLTITEETDWTAILSKDKYKNGVEIYYTIDEEEVAEYLTTIDGYTVTNKYIVPPHTGIEVDDNQTLYGTVVALIFSLLGSLFLLKNKLSK